MPDLSSAPPTWRVDTLFRRIFGLSLLISMPALVWFTRNVEWGVGIMVWLPAAIAWLLAIPLTWRRVISHSQDHLAIGPDTLPLSGASLEIAPTAGLQAVIIHTDDGEHAVATWLSKRRAEDLAAWIDQHAAQPLPRTSRERHRLDY